MAVARFVDGSSRNSEREPSDTNQLELAMADADAGDTKDVTGNIASDTGGKTMGRRLAQQSGGTGTPGHSGTGAEDTTATPGRVSPGSTGGGGLVGGSAIGDDGIGDAEGGLVGGIGGTGGAGGAPVGGEESSSGLLDTTASGMVGKPSTPITGGTAGGAFGGTGASGDPPA